MLQITVTVQNQLTIADLEKMLFQVTNLFTPLAEAGFFWSGKMASNFAEAPWPALSPNTVALKEAMGYPADPLVRTGAMRDTATSGTWEITQDTAMLRLPDYSGFHLSGTRFMPARDFTELDDSTVIQMAMAFVDWVLAPL